jgi:hypothetical protein
MHEAESGTMNKQMKHANSYFSPLQTISVAMLTGWKSQGVSEW